MVATFTDYKSGSGGQAGESNNASPSSKDPYWTLERLKRSYLDYLGSKRDEIKEQQDARRYRHGSQWTSEQITIFNKRKQPIVTNNVISRKINGVIGLIEKLRQAPKAFARTPKEEQGADLATAVVRYVLDEQRWKEKSPVAAETSAVDGYGGIEIVIEQGDQGDPEVGFEVVDSDEFFYDPRSYRGDFSDCRFLGRAKWVDMEAAKEMFPDKASDLDDSLGDELSTNSDREQKWFFSEENVRRVRIVDEWYKKNGDWYWCTYTGSVKLSEGKSPFIDEKKKTFCKFVMFSSYIDQDGDRYGFIRNLKSLQDEVNQRRSKGLHLLNQRRIIAEDGAFDDVEKARVEATRADAVVIYNKGFEAKFDDQVKMLETDAQLKFLQEAKEELEQFGPTLSLIGDTGNQNQSGRAISLQQQAGIAQLGPFMVNYRSWKLRVYRAIWNAVKTHWTAERWIRVTDDESSQSYVGLNQVGINPQTGMPAMINQISTLDVDIILDEGPDSINMMADTFEALNALAQNGVQVPPELIIEVAPGLDSSTRQKWIKKFSTPDPMQEQAKQLEIALATAKVKDTEAQAMGKQVDAMKTVEGDTPLAKAQTLKTLMEAGQSPEGAGVDPMELMKAQQEAQAQQAEQARKDQELQLKMQAEEAKQRREEEAHQANMAEKSIKMQLEQHKAQRDDRNSDREYDLKVKAQKSTEAQNAAEAKPSKNEEGISTAISAMVQSTNIMAQAVSKLADNASATAMTHAAETMAKAQMAPKRIVRDKSGRVSHVETGR